MGSLFKSRKGEVQPAGPVDPTAAGGSDHMDPGPVQDGIDLELDDLLDDVDQVAIEDLPVTVEEDHPEIQDPELPGEVALVTPGGEVFKNEDGLDPWIKRFKNQCLQIPGKHILIIGITGSGKTQLMYYILDGVLFCNQDETIVWFDTGKSSEILTLAQFGPITVLMPDDPLLDIEIKTRKKLDIEIVRVRDYKDAWSKIKKNRINIFCFEPFILNPDVYTKILAGLFNTLIHKAHNYDIIVPLSVFCDEFHRVAPSREHGHPAQQFDGVVIEHNVERLRSLKVRIVAAIQGWTKLRKGVRSSFPFLAIKRGANFERDQRKLERYNELFEKLETNETILVYENRIFSDVVHTPGYGDGEKFGRVRYIGVWELKTRKRKKVDDLDGDEVVFDLPVDVIIEAKRNLDRAAGETDPDIRSWLIRDAENLIKGQDETPGYKIIKSMLDRLKDENK